MDKTPVISAKIMIYLDAPDIFLGKVSLVRVELQRTRYPGRKRIGCPATAAVDGSCKARAGRTRVQIENFLVEGHGLTLAGCSQILQRGSSELRAGNLREGVGRQDDA